MPASEQKKLPGIFISYRRSDNPDAVGRIYDRLVSEFGKARVFKDVDSIPLGQDFRGHLNEIIGGCVAVLAIIGPKWTDIRNEDGKRRLEDPDDFVRIELEAALSRNVPVVPVLVGHAPMPGTSQLPSTLSSLAFRQSIEVRPDPDFHNDATRLVTALRAIIDPDAPQVPAVVSTDRRGITSRWTWPAAFTVAALAAVALAIPAVRHFGEVPPPELRTEIITPATNDPTFALSPDGRAIVYVAKDGEVNRLWLRSLSTSTARPLPGTDSATAPFWSPDGQSIGFFANNSLKRFDIASEQGRVLGPAGPSAHGTWNADGVILYVANPASPLLRISANGGVADVLVPKSELHPAIRSPLLLPDGRHFLFVSLAGSAPGIYLGSMAGSPPVRLTNDVGYFAYLSSGWLLWNRTGTLFAQRLDLDENRTGGGGCNHCRQCRRALHVSERPGCVQGNSGNRVAAELAGPEWQVAGHDRRIHRAVQPSSRFSGRSPCGRRPDCAGQVGYPPAGRDAKRPDHFRWKGECFSNLGARRRAHRVSVRDCRCVRVLPKVCKRDGEPELIFGSAQPKFPTSWSADGRYLLYFSASPEVAADLAVLPMTRDRKPSVLLATPHFEVWPRFSPDGRWVAYTSSESGRGEVHVRPFVQSGPGGGAPGLGSGRWQVSTAGGTMPNWRRDGRELFFLGPAGEMMASTIEVNGATLTPGTPVKLFDTRVPGGGVDDVAGRQYDVSSDGRFLINEVPEAEATPITLIQNWNPDADK